MSSGDIIVKRPISDKIGACVWPYIGNTQGQVKACSDAGMSYVAVGNVNRKSEDYAVHTDDLNSCAAAADEYGLKLMIDFGASDLPDGATADEIGKMKENMLEVMNLFKNKNVIWLGWNEPNGTFWTSKGQPTAQTDYATVKASTDMEIWLAQQERQIDPSGIVAAPSMFMAPDYNDPNGNNRNYFELVRQLGLFNYCDAVSIHPYMLKKYDNGSPESLITQGQLKSVNLPMISNEFGFSHYRESGDSSWQGLWSISDAAKLTLRQILIMDYIDYAIIGLYTAQTGLVLSITNDDCSLNEVGLAIKWLISELDGYTLDSKIEIADHVGYVDDLYLMKYTKDGANDKLVYWTPSRIGELYGLVYEDNFYKLRFSDYPQILETGSSSFVEQYNAPQENAPQPDNDDLVNVDDTDWSTVLGNGGD